ncbi:MAG: translation elongation factor Ts [Planctomycetota bacterium]|mgnify:CR=1 FL=1
MNITTQLIKELREKTGVGMMECKTALAETNCDIPKAVEYLKRQGLKVAEKKQDKATRAGRVGAYIHTNGKVGAMIELGCETDFVAKNEEFGELLKDLCLQIAAMGPQFVSRTDLSSDILEKEKEFYRQEIAKEGDAKKPLQVIDKIVEGKLEKLFYSRKCLLDQVFIKDDKIKIGDLIKTNIAKFGENIVVKKFARFELGATD